MTGSPDARPSLGPVIRIDRHHRSYLIHDPGGRIGVPIAEGRPYEHRLLDRIHGLGKTGSALDVGAHVGNHALYLAAICGLTVHAFEPSPRAYPALVANVELNDLPITPYRLAVGPVSTTGRVDSLMRFVEDEDGEVPMRSIDSMLDLDDLAVVKIDVEGGEPGALLGMREHLLRCSPSIFTEVHGRTAHRAQIAVLAPLGYQEVGRVQMGSLMMHWERS